jgi:hypothetical protein
MRSVRGSNLKEVYDTPVLDEVLTIIDEVEEEFAWRQEDEW